MNFKKIHQEILKKELKIQHNKERNREKWYNKNSKIKT